MCAMAVMFLQVFSVRRVISLSCLDSKGEFGKGRRNKPLVKILVFALFIFSSTSRHAILRSLSMFCSSEESVEKKDNVIGCEANVS